MTMKTMYGYRPHINLYGNHMNLGISQILRRAACIEAEARDSLAVSVPGHGDLSLW